VGSSFGGLGFGPVIIYCDRVLGRVVFLVGLAVLTEVSLIRDPPPKIGVIF